MPENSSELIIIIIQRVETSDTKNLKSFHITGGGGVVDTKSTKISSDINMA